MFWLCITTRANWEVIKTKNIWGVEPRHLKTLQRVKVGDKLVFYVKQEVRGREKLPSMLVGIFEVISKPFKDETKIFTGGLYPWRIRIKPIKLGEVKFKPLIPKLKFIKNKSGWTGYLMGKAMREIPEEDYKLIESLMKQNY